VVRILRRIKLVYSIFKSVQKIKESKIAVEKPIENPFSEWM
jgi:hypothetical protein